MVCFKTYWSALKRLFYLLLYIVYPEIFTIFVNLHNLINDLSIVWKIAYYCWIIVKLLAYIIDITVKILYNRYSKGAWRYAEKENIQHPAWMEKHQKPRVPFGKGCKAGRKDLYHRAVRQGQLRKLYLSEFL